MVHGLHGEIERHELDDRLEPGERSANAETGEAVLGDRSIDHPHGAELLQQALGHLVGTLILGHLLAHDEDVLVASHFLSHGVAQRFAHGHGHHLGAFRNVPFGTRLRQRWRRGGGGRGGAQAACCSGLAGGALPTAFG